MKQDGIKRAIWLCDFGLQFLFRMPAVSRRYCAGAKRSGSGRARGGQAAGVLQSSGIHRGDGGAGAGRAAGVPADARENIQIVYIAHSIPLSMANTCDYVRQLEEVRRLVSARLGIKMTLSCIRAAAARRDSLAGARHSGLPARGEGKNLASGGGACADRLYLRSHGSAV